MINLSATSGTRMGRAISGTLFCVAVALLVDSPNFSHKDPAQLQRAIMVTILLPTFLAGLLLFLLLGKIRHLLNTPILP